MWKITALVFDSFAVGICSFCSLQASAMTQLLNDGKSDEAIVPHFRAIIPRAAKLMMFTMTGGAVANVLAFHASHHKEWNFLLAAGCDLFILLFSFSVLSPAMKNMFTDKPNVKETIPTFAKLQTFRGLASAGAFGLALLSFCPDIHIFTATTARM